MLPNYPHCVPRLIEAGIHRIRMPVLWLLPCRAVPCSPHAYSAILALRHPKRAAASPSTLWEDCHNNGGMGTGLLCVHMRGRSLPNPEPVDVPVHRCVCAEHMTAARAAHAGPGPFSVQNQGKVIRTGWVSLPCLGLALTTVSCRDGAAVAPSARVVELAGKSRQSRVRAGCR